MSWMQQAHLFASDGAPGDGFGGSVAISGGTVVIGARGDDTSAGADAGSAYIFVRNGTIWYEQTRLVSDAPCRRQTGPITQEPCPTFFGASVAISGDTAIIGAPGTEGPLAVTSYAGYAHIFVRNGATWHQQARLSGPPQLGTVVNELFGRKVDISGGTAVVAYQSVLLFTFPSPGACFCATFFMRNGTAWLEQGSAGVSGNVSFSPRSGDMAISGDTAIISAPEVTVRLPAPPFERIIFGVARVVVRSGGGWTDQVNLASIAADESINFGSSAALSGNTALIGDGSSTYVFTRTGTIWTEQAKLPFKGPTAIRGDTVIIGAPGEDTPTGADAGAAYVFRIGATTDTTPPVITPTITGTQGTNGWYTSPVTVSWNVTDAESAITSSSGCGPVTLTADTAGTVLTCMTTNSVGLSNSASVTIRIDRRAPNISGLPVSGCSLWPPNHKLVQVGVVSASAGLSGLSSFAVTGRSNEPENGNSDGDTAPDIIITGAGLNPRTVQLRAERSAAGNGRIYTINATATTGAGITSTATVTCVVPHDRGR